MTVRDRAMRELVGVVAEHAAARKAVAFLLSEAGRDPTLLQRDDPTLEHLRTCLVNLEPTYIVRLFALFEETLRDIWFRSFKKKSHPVTQVLLDVCASKRSVSQDDVLPNAHGVRRYRNFLIHGKPAPAVTLDVAKSRLCKFLAWMPESW